MTEREKRMPGTRYHPIPSATLILIRIVDSKIMVYLIQRSLKARFMPGNYVFPGGITDPSDKDTPFWQNHIDQSLKEAEKRLGSRANLFYAITAIRETFEEAEALFARSRTKMRIDPDLKRRCQKEKDHRDGWFQALIDEMNWELTLSRLNLFGHWITPVGKPYRYDTRYFWAVLPPDERCRFDPRESINDLWITPMDALRENHKGRIRLSPPTLVTLFELFRLETLSRLEKRHPGRNWQNPLMPRSIQVQQGEVLIEPWDPLYHAPHIPFDMASIQKAILPFDAPFSRIWNHNGHALPIAAIAGT